jgi:septal ring factor EnvC (AmiA/AmiB activator)
VAKELVERELGEIRGCLKAIDDGILTLRNENADIFTRLRNVESKQAVLEEKIKTIEANIIEKQEEAEREKDREVSRTNNKIALVAIVLTIIELVIGAVITFIK